MKKANIINLIKYYSEKNDSGFRHEAYEIAKNFDKMGDYQLAEYIMALLSEANTFTVQEAEIKSEFLNEISDSNKTLPLPEDIEADILGVINAIRRNIGINKILFEGAPGTGKTETVKHMARILDRKLYIVDFSRVIDSRLGQTSKNISSLFDQINSFINPEKIMILFDEIDAIALNRVDSNDLREMGRATSTLLRRFDNLNENIVIIATTNLFESFDKALIRRFDSIVDFNRYSDEDLMEISEIMLNEYMNKMKISGRNIRIFRKIMKLYEKMPYPGELKNIIKTSIAFSDIDDEYDYLKRLYKSVYKGSITIKKLQEQGFTLREIEILTGISKSSVSRELKEV